MTVEKEAAPLERSLPPKGGFWDSKKVLLASAGMVVVLGMSAWGFTFEGEAVEEIPVSDVTPANLNVSEARPPDRVVPTADPNVESDPAADPVVQQTQAAMTHTPAKPKGAPEGFKKTSPIIMRASVDGGSGQPGVQPSPETRQSGGFHGGQTGGYDSQRDGYGDEESYPGQQGHQGAGGRSNQRGSRQSNQSNKMDFYRGSGVDDALDIAGSMSAELPGCVVKAGEQITLQTRSEVRTTLPQKILGYVVNPIEGDEYLGRGRVRPCLAVRPGSRVLVEINASGVERGDLRIQACAIRIDLLGGGRRPLGCQPAHGADGGAGIEASSDYDVAGIATGILIEAALASARGLGGLIAGPAGVAVQVGGGMIGDVGSEYVRNNLMKAPTLTMKSGAIFSIQLNGDLSFPID